jgi:hypothetical protein
MLLFDERKENSCPAVQQSICPQLAGRLLPNIEARLKNLKHLKLNTTLAVVLLIIKPYWFVHQC